MPVLGGRVRVESWLGTLWDSPPSSQCQYRRFPDRGLRPATGPPRMADKVTPRQVARLGRTVRLQCPVEGDPPPLTMWTKDGRTIHGGWSRFRVLPQGLRVKEVEREDAGAYVCKATNGFGSLSVNYTLIVTGQCGRKGHGQGRGVGRAGFPVAPTQPCLPALGPGRPATSCQPRTGPTSVTPPAWALLSPHPRDLSSPEVLLAWSRGSRGSRSGYGCPGWGSR